jgi:hypothetical protein
MPATPVDNSTVSPTQSAKNPGMTLDNNLSFSVNIKAVTGSCRFRLYNIRRVRPYLNQEVMQVLIQALIMSPQNNCISPLAVIPACAIKPCNLSRIPQPAWCSTFPCPHAPLAASQSLHPLQDHDTCLLSSKRNYPFLPSGSAQNLHPNPSTLFCHLWSLGSPTPTGGQLLLIPVQALLCPGTTMFEPASS